MKPYEPDAPHLLLLSLVGVWEGVTRTWLDPQDAPDQSGWSGTIVPILGGRFIQHYYTGSVGDTPFSGMAVYGYDNLIELYTVAWMDTFHTGTSTIYSTGPGDENGFSVLGSYLDPGSGQMWGWRSVVRLEAPERLVLEAYNLAPEGQETPALATVYERRA